MLKEHSWPSHNANLHNSISSSLSCNPVVEIGSVNHYLCEFNILQKLLTSLAHWAWQNIAGNLQIHGQKKIALVI